MEPALAQLLWGFASLLSGGLLVKGVELAIKVLPQRSVPDGAALARAQLLHELEYYSQERRDVQAELLRTASERDQWHERYFAECDGHNDTRRRLTASQRRNQELLRRIGDLEARHA